MNVERNLLVGTIAAAIIVALLVIAYVGEETRMARETDAQQGKLIARGARLYDNYCAGCHGRRGEGLSGIYPPLNLEDLWSSKEEIAFYGTLHDYISLNISAGHPAQRMPSWADEYGGPLRNDQVEDITQFVMNWMGPQPEGVRVEDVEFRPAVAETVPAGTPPPVAAGDAEKGGQIFAATCVACHGSNADGTTLGPTLISAQVAVKSDEVLRNAITNGQPGTSMPPWSGVLSSQDIEDVLAYLKSLTGRAPPVPPTPSKEKEGQEATPTLTESAEAGEPTLALPAADPLIGQSLFTGVERLQNGGPSCLTCHTVSSDAALGGGTLGPDLTSAFDKFGDAGFAGVLADLGFPTMAPIYGDRPLTSEEQAHLRAFLQEAATRRPTQPTRQLGLWALGGFLALIVLTQIVWRGRLRGVRRTLVEMGRR